MFDNYNYYLLTPELIHHLLSSGLDEKKIDCIPIYINI
jgi:hypothetical protein